MCPIISIYPPQASANLPQPFLSSYPQQCKNYASSTLSHLSCKPPRLDDIHPRLPSPGFRHPAAHQNGNESWKNRKRGERGRATELSERVMKSEMFFMQRRVTSLCTKGNLVWMEQRALRFREFAIAPGRWNGLGGGNGPFDVLCSDVYGEQFERDAFIQTQRQMESDTHTRKHSHNHCKNVRTHTLRWHRCAHPHLHKSLYTPGSGGCENTDTYTQIQVIIPSTFLTHTFFFAIEKDMTKSGTLTWQDDFQTV